MPRKKRKQPTAGLEFLKARELKVIKTAEFDETPEGVLRVASVKELICQLVLLGKQKGRPRLAREDHDEAA